MGIYPTIRYYDVNTGLELQASQLRALSAWYEEYNDFSGLIRVRLVTADPCAEWRTACYCCSCGDRPGSDVYCRNHGFAGERPCDLHAQPGSPDQETGKMPDPVSVERSRHIFTR